MIKENFFLLYSNIFKLYDTEKLEKVLHIFFIILNSSVRVIEHKLNRIWL